ncbi:MAG: hypothetical protein SGJ19_29100 [Planctomycetia bacterium]|nr:hypothetical protein [Planctomycetia bacterium]
MLRFRLPTLLLLTAVFAFGLFVVDNLSVAVWDGSFDLTVHLNYGERAQLERLAYLVEQNRAMAEWVAVNPEHHGDWFEPVDDPNVPFVVGVNCYGRESTFGRELSYGEFECLIVKARFVDGTERIDVLDIPKGRHARSMSVTLGPRQDSPAVDE